MHDKSLLLYARAYDLVEDHTSISPLSFICLPYDAEEEATDPSFLISSVLKSLKCWTDVRPPSNERLEANKEVGTLLSKTLSLRGYIESFEDEYSILDNLRLDEPLLQFSASSSLGNTLGKRLDLTNLPLEELISKGENDEGLQFPIWAWGRRNEIAEDLAGDRMTVDRKVLEYLRKIVKNPNAPEMETSSEYEEADNNSYVTHPGEVTPPLSPLTTPSNPLPPIPLHELAEQLRPLSINNEDYLAPITTFEAGRLQNDILDESLETMQLLQVIQQPPLASSPRVGTPMRPFRLEPLLTPPFTSPNRSSFFSESANVTIPSSPSHRPTKRVKFTDIVDDFLIPPSLDPSDDGYDAGNIGQHDFLTQSAMAQFTLEVMEPGAQFFLMKLQQEQLEDSTQIGNEPQDGLRVELPIVSWQRPTPPWSSNETLSEIFGNAANQELIKKWEYRKSLDIAGLCWTIGLPTPNFRIIETIFPEDEERLWEQIEEAYPIVPLETIIEDEDKSFWESSTQEDEELEPAKIEPKTDLESLIERKRQKTSTNQNIQIATSLLDPKSNLFAFLSLQNRNYETSIGPQIHSSSAPSSPAPSAPSCSQTNPSTTQFSSIPPDPSSSFIVSASFLVNRSLYKIIRSYCPTSKFVERDFEPYPDQKLFGKQEQVPEEHNLEADIIISPLIGLVLTDLQTIRRRILPTALSNAKNKSTTTPCREIRDRISELSRRYQNLIVGVSIDFGGDSDGLAELGTADCSTLAAFIGFCEGIGGVEVAVVSAGGCGQQRFGKWIVEIMGLHSMRWRHIGLQVKLTDRESTWENFLRNGGMNSYAAQAVLTKLRESECGLVDFVTIEKESRRVIFEQFVGNKVLENFEEVVGADWSHILKM